MSTFDDRLYGDKFGTVGVGHNKPPSFAETMQERYGSVFATLEPIAEAAEDAPETVEDDAGLGKVSDIVRGARRLFAEIEEFRKKEKKFFLDGGREVDTYFARKLGAVERVQSAMQQRADVYQEKKDAAERAKANAAAAAAREAELEQSRLAEMARNQNNEVAENAHVQAASAAAVQAEERESRASAPVADLTRVRTDDGVTSATTEWLFEITDYAAVDLNAIRSYIPRERVEMGIKGFIKINKDKVALAGVRIYPKTKAVIR